MQWLVDVWARVLVLARSLPGRVIALAAVVSALAEQIAGVLPAEAAADPAAVVVQILTAVAAIIVVVRNVTPVPVEQRGILPRQTNTVDAAADDSVPTLGGSRASIRQPDG